MVDITEQAQLVIEQAASDGPEFSYTGAVPPERTAWLVLLAAFALFCSLTLTSVFGVYHFLFQSTVALPAALKVSKGTVGITGADFIEAVERGSQVLTNTSTSITTDSLSQATIQFRNTSEADTEDAGLLAAVTLQGNTFVTFHHARAPRFEWSQNPQSVQFSRLKGQLDIIVTGVGDKPFLMDIYADDINSNNGVHIHLVENGRYRVRVSEDEVRLYTLAGVGTAFFQDDAGNRETARAGQELVARIGNRSWPEVRETENILASGDFSLLDVDALRSQGLMAPEKWSCAATQDSAPEGSYQLADEDGRVGIRLSRFDNATSHGEVACVQEFEGDGLDVYSYDSLRFVATFSLNYQSLSVCGKEGSECPLMLEIDYLDGFGRPEKWYRGFYSEEADSGGFRKRCVSCLQEHVNTNESVWYTFDSDNILDLMGESDRPVSINAIRFYASGHQFDTIISDIMLLVSRPVDSEGG